MQATDLAHPVISGALATAAALVGMEVVFIGGLTDETFAFQRVVGCDWPGVGEGLELPRTDSFCHRMLSGAASATADAEADPAFRDSPARKELGIRSYVGVPILASDGSVLGTLCGIDHASKSVDEVTIRVLRELAHIIAVHLAEAEAGGGSATGVVIRRTPGGWAVSAPGADEDTGNDLTSAMVLADLVAQEISPGQRPTRADADLDEVERLRLSVVQLEHALAARVLVEQAIGVLAERQRVAPRQAFERLRKASRSRGRKVHELAREVVASTTDRGVPLPPELAGGQLPGGQRQAGH